MPSSVEEFLEEAFAAPVIGLGCAEITPRVHWGSRRSGLPFRFGCRQVLQLALIQEDAATFGALLNVHAIPLVGAHRSVTLGADQLSHVSMVRDH